MTGDSIGHMSAATVRPAAQGDLAAIEALLLAASLPPEGLTDQFPSAYAIAELDGAIIGAAGLERYEDSGLLRSVVVVERCRGQGVGEALVRERLRQAQGQGIRRVYALTTTAASYFPRIGFVPAERAAAPEAVKGSPQFASVCPASAAFLEYRFSP
jgi:amino-acid N-acetyltransferase